MLTVEVLFLYINHVLGLMSEEFEYEAMLVLTLFQGHIFRDYQWEAY